MVALGVLTCFSSGLLVYASDWMRIRTKGWYADACALLTILAGVFCIIYRSGRDINSYSGLDNETAKQLAEVVNASHSGHSSVVYVSNEFFTYFWFGYLKGNFMPQWYSPIEVGHFDTLLQGVQTPHDIWLIIDRTHMPPNINPYVSRQRISRYAYELEGRWVGDYEVFRYRFTTMRMETLDRKWVAGLRLRSMALDSQVVTSGESIRINLVFTTEKQLSQNYSLYLHLIPREGHIIASRDGQPHYGGAPTSTWIAGQPHVERRAIVIPEGTPEGEYKLVCGWYTDTGVRLAPSVGEGEIIDRSVVLGTVRVSAD